MEKALVAQLDNKAKRDVALDLLRVIGMFSIILAHVSPPDTLAEMRVFDVVLLVFISGVSYGITNQKNIESIGNYCEYIKKRFKRLIVPAWMFLTMYFVAGGGY